MNNAYLEDVLASADGFMAAIQPAFGALTAAQLNWKPSPQRWSIAQCLDHILITNKLYFPMLVQIADGTRRSRKRERLPLLPRMWGKMLVQASGPEGRRKTKTASHLEPSSSTIDPGILTEVVDNLQILKDLILRTDHVDHSETVITSPVAGFITYTLQDGCTIMVAHAHRHLKQAKEVQAEAAFPTA